MAERLGDKIQYPGMKQPEDSWWDAVKRRLTGGEQRPAMQKPAAAPAPSASSPVDPDKWKKFQQNYND